jgi:hypothetical protein
MATLRIYDTRQQVLAFDLRDILHLLAPMALQVTWTVSTVKSSEPDHDWFEATGEEGKRLEALAQADTRLSGVELTALAEKTRQVIWGEFIASPSSGTDERWIIVRAVDSTFYEITTFDEAVIKVIKSSFKDVRIADAPIA